MPAPELSPHGCNPETLPRSATEATTHADTLSARSGQARMDLNLLGRHALICGASEGIGRAAAHELALLGALAPFYHSKLYHSS